MTKNEKTKEEEIDYVRFMTLDKNVDPNVYIVIPNDIREKIKEYIDDKMTATRFSNDKNGKGSSEQVTSEVIYYWMITQNIPFECEKWHLNRLLTLIKVCDVKNKPPKKMGNKEIMRCNSSLNNARRKQLNTKG